MAGTLNTKERGELAIKEGKVRVYILRGRETMRLRGNPLRGRGAITQDGKADKDQGK